MDLSTKLQPVFIILSALAGLALGYLTTFGNYSVSLIEPFLMVLLYFVFLSVDGQKLKQSFLNIKFTAMALAVNFLWTPAFAYCLGLAFFGSSVDLQMGLVMLMVTPCTDWYLVFTGIAKGNVELGASILPLNLLLQILLLPVYLLLFFGGNINFNGFSVIVSIITVLIIPFVLALLTKAIGKQRESWSSGIQMLKNQSDAAQLIFLCLAVVSMFASESKNVFENPALLLRMMIPLVIFFAVNFILVQFIGKKAELSARDTTALNFTTLARNSPLSLAIAVAAFPDRPLISLALVIGPLIELPALSIIANIIKKKRV